MSDALVLVATVAAVAEHVGGSEQASRADACGWIPWVGHDEVLLLAHHTVSSPLGYGKSVVTVLVLRRDLDEFPAPRTPPRSQRTLLTDDFQAGRAELDRRLRMTWAAGEFCIPEGGSCGRFLETNAATHAGG
jgi:hypothetical protein